MRKAGSCDGTCPASKINHLVVVVPENHTFDSYFGHYCTAAAGSSPTCSDGAACCERAPDTEPSGAAPVALDDNENGAYDPSHQSDCERIEVDGGKMDHFVAGNATCGDPRNFAIADAATVQGYWDLAAGGALADRWFQPTIGASASNDMYLVTARLVFADNAVVPNADGAECSFIPTRMSFSVPNIGDLLDAGAVSWSWYAQGYADMLNAEQQSKCPDPPDACGAGLPIYPCVFDPSDIPTEYFPQFTDNPKYLRDYAAFAADLDSGMLPQVAFVKPAGFRSEHPGLHTTISDGVAFVRGVVDAVAKSAYAPDTLILVVYDEGGGFFDHVAPPADSTVDGQPYGTRVPVLAIGPQARKGTVSHVTMEHSSVVKFIEWNWLKTTGQLQARDAVVANIGSLLDPSLGVPEN